MLEQHFDEINNIKTQLKKVLKAIPEKYYYKCIDDWKKCWASFEDYFKRNKSYLKE